MEYKVVFTIERKKGCCPAVQEVIKMHCCSGTPLQVLFWRDVKRILKRRDSVHPLVMKWVGDEKNLGIRVDVYKMVPERSWRYGQRL